MSFCYQESFKSKLKTVRRDHPGLDGFKAKAVAQLATDEELNTARDARRGFGRGARAVRAQKRAWNPVPRTDTQLNERTSAFLDSSDSPEDLTPDSELRSEASSVITDNPAMMALTRGSGKIAAKSITHSLLQMVHEEHPPVSRHTKSKSQKQRKPGRQTQKIIAPGTHPMIKQEPIELIAIADEDVPAQPQIDPSNFASPATLKSASRIVKQPLGVAEQGNTRVIDGDTPQSEDEQDEDEEDVLLELKKIELQQKLRQIRKKAKRMQKRSQASLQNSE